MEKNFNCLIMGAAGRDFHDFQTFFRERPHMVARAFTAAQIPFIAERSFPRSMAGPHYDSDIPIYPEEQLPALIRELDIDFVFLAYSDLSYRDVMHKASLVQSLGASFVILGPKHTQLRSNRPVISVTAVRTGAGKSPITQWLARTLSGKGHRVVVVRHPMPYGDLCAQAVQRFALAADLDRFDCTIEEREEFEPYLEQGLVVYSGVDYARILTQVEAEADVILWDGGNNDYSFFCPRLSIVVADALRPGHEIDYYPGETNLRSADVVVINKVGGATADAVEQIRRNIARLNPRAHVLEGDLDIALDDAAAVRGKRAVVVEDGPTLTHGGMSYGAGTLAARQFDCTVVDPRPGAVGTIAEAYRQYPHLKDVLPALGYSAQQRRELAETIAATNAEVVIDASPARLDRLLSLSIPIARVRYRFRQTQGPALEVLVERSLEATD